MSANRRRICFVTTVESAVLCFLLGQLRQLETSYDITLVVNTDDPGFLARRGVRIRVVPFPIERKISLWRDLRALIFLVRFFRRERFDMIQSLMPKAGLLAMVSGRLAGIRVRSHIFTGQVWATRKGLMRWLLKSMDRFMAVCATHLLSDSPSQRKFLIEQGIVSANRIRVLHKGSMCGVDVNRFRPNPAVRKKIRTGMGIPDTALVFIYVGRLNRDKGVLDLAHAFGNLGRERKDVWLLVVGPEEESGIVEQIQRLAKGAAGRMIFTGFSSAPEDFMAASDVFCLPSYRESFGDVIIEAAAVGLPSITTKIYGLEGDTVVDGEHGLLHQPGDVGSLAVCMRRLVEDAELRERLGRQARERAIRDFSSEQVTRAWLDYYASALRSHSVDDDV